MKVKNVFELYGRNAMGVFWGGLPESLRWEIAYLPFLLVHLVLLPITMTFGAALKTLIDFFTRKELSQEQKAALAQKLQSADRNSMDLLVNNRLRNYPAQSNASKLLENQLYELQTGAISNKCRAEYKKKHALQLDQLTSEGHRDPSAVYTDEDIYNLPLDERHQIEFNTFVSENVAELEAERVKALKAAIQEYLGAEKNAGKKMQHVIYQHFFAQDAAGVRDEDYTFRYKPVRPIRV